MSFDALTLGGLVMIAVSAGIVLGLVRSNRP